MQDLRQVFDFQIQNLRLVKCYKKKIFLRFNINFCLNTRDTSLKPRFRDQQMMNKNDKVLLLGKVQNHFYE